MKKLFYILTAMLALSCSESDVDKEADLITKSFVANEPGFEWFLTEYNSYSPNAMLLQGVDQEIESNDKFVIFIKPTCRCQGTQKDFPQLLKAFEEAGVPESKYEIYAMKEDYNHPYMDKVTFNELPQAFLFTNDQPKYSLFDSLNTYRQNEEIVEDIDRVEYYLSAAAKI